MDHYAFISYSHEDIKAVRKFHKKVESFSIPRIVRRMVNDCPRKLYPVFRDETDLSGVMLTPMVEEALEHTAFLIVICTENSARSVWVKREINTFLKHHSPENIIPVFFSKRTKEAFEENFPGMLSELNVAKDNCVLYCFGHGKRSLFEITARVLQCYSPQLVKRYSDGRDNLQILKLMLWIFVICIVFNEVSWMYKESHTITKYCRDISFCYDWPEAIDPVDDVSQLSTDDYYICTYHKNRIIRIEHVYPENAQRSNPGNFFLEADCMEFYYNNFWQSQARISKVVFLDKNDQVLFVKNFSLECGIVDLTEASDSSDPHFLPDDTTCSMLSYEEAERNALYSCRIAQIYNEAGQISQIWFLSDTFSYYACDQNGYYGIAYTYHDSGDPAMVQYLALDGTPLKTCTFRSQ